MDSSFIRNKIIENFNSARSNPNSYYNESHFLDFLVNPPSPKNSLKNSFKGTKKYYDFMKILELEFGICFTYSDLDSYYSVDRIVKKIEERARKHRGNLMLINQRNRRSIRNYSIYIILTIALGILLSIIDSFLIESFVLLGYITILLKIYLAEIRDKKHNQKVYQKIMNKS